jgi:hypothetical protein
MVNDPATEVFAGQFSSYKEVENRKKEIMGKMMMSAEFVKIYKINVG